MSAATVDLFMQGGLVDGFLWYLDSYFLNNKELCNGHREKDGGCEYWENVEL